MMDYLHEDLHSFDVCCPPEWTVEQTVRFVILKCFINVSPPNAAYMRQWTGSALVQIMACRLFGAKPLPEPMLTDYQLEP